MTHKNQPSKGHYLNYIAGEWTDCENRISVLNPANGREIATVACAGPEHIDHAVKSARVCVNSCVLTDPRPVERARIVYRIAEEIRKLSDEGARLLVSENGKTLEQAHSEFENAAGYFEYYAGMADKIEGTSIPLGEDYIDFTIYEPMGISAQIVPWNFPVDLCARSLAPALAAGNAVVVKSPELTPLAMTYIALACERAGLPNGALSMLCGYGADAGAALAAHSDIDQIVFTGSVATGQSIMRSAAERAIPCVMELGGKSAAVVFADADLDVLMSSVDWGIFFNAGQVCSAMSRLIVHEDIHDQVVERVTQLAHEQILGSGFEDVSLTPLASESQQQQVLQMCEQAIAEGAELVTGGQPGAMDGYFVEPTVFTNVLPEMQVFQDEVFGPVLSLTKFKTEEQAWQLANATKFGLVAGVFSNDLNICMRGAKALRAGQIFINEWYAGELKPRLGGWNYEAMAERKGRKLALAMWRHKM